MWRLRWMTDENVRGHHQHSTERAVVVSTFILKGIRKKVEKGDRTGQVGIEQVRKWREHGVSEVRVNAGVGQRCERSALRVGQITDEVRPTGAGQCTCFILVRLTLQNGPSVRDTRRDRRADGTPLSLRADSGTRCQPHTVPPWRPLEPF